MLQDDILALLRSDPGGYRSGEAMSRTLAVSRAAVWKAVEALRSAGYEIVSAPNRGYCLSAAPDDLRAGEIAAALSLRDTFLSAIIRRYPGLRTEEAPHRLELCGGPRCSGRGAARLAAFVEETYGVRPGGVSASGRFTYRITGCMKNCPNGPSLRWDGALHSRADEALIRALVDEGGGRPSP